MDRYQKFQAQQAADLERANRENQERELQQAQQAQDDQQRRNFEIQADLSRREADRQDMIQRGLHNS